MSRNTKIVLGIIGGLLLMCCLFAAIAAWLLPRYAVNFAERAFTDDPQRAAQISQEIVDYSLPPGFQEEGGMSLLGIDMVFITHAQSSDAVIMFMSFPQALAGNEEEMRRQMEESFAQQMGERDITLSSTGTREITINDKPAILSIYEGSDEAGRNIRQATAVFESKKGGPAMVMMFSPTADWDRLGFEQFIASMR